MMHWASVVDFAEKVNFLMVCVEVGQSGLRTAQDFGKRFQLREPLVNGYVDEKQESPSFGQLGCGGFVVVGPHGEFAVQRTVPSFTERGELGFRAVEHLLLSLYNVGLAGPAAEAAAGGAAAAAGVPAESMRVLIMSPVGVPDMDREHEALERAVAELSGAQAPAPELARRLLALWQEHSEHEEQLFDRFDFGRHRSAGPDRAATRSHCEHHRLITAMMQEWLADGAAPPRQIHQIASEMQRHSEIYDAAYVGNLEGPQGSGSHVAAM